MRGKAILIAAAIVLVLAGGGAAAYVATKDDDRGSASELALGQEPSQTQTDGSPAPATPTETAPPDSIETETAPSGTPSGTTPDEPSPTRTEKSTPSKTDRPARDFAVPPAHRFSGTGNTPLGTVDVRATSILRWKAKGHFEVRFGSEDFSIIAPTKSGQLVVPPFRFDHVRVIARGAWTISISPQK